MYRFEVTYAICKWHKYACTGTTSTRWRSPLQWPCDVRCVMCARSRKEERRKKRKENEEEGKKWQLLFINVTIIIIRKRRRRWRDSIHTAAKRVLKKEGKRGSLITAHNTQWCVCVCHSFKKSVVIKNISCWLHSLNHTPSFDLLLHSSLYYGQIIHQY